MYGKGAQAGDGSAAFKLACMYEGDMGIDADEERAKGLFLQAARFGVPEAMFRLAVFAYEGKVEGGKPLAAEWYTRCAEQIPIARFNLATMYFTGDGVSQDKEKAFSLYLPLADSGDADAAFQIGRMYLNGEGVHADPQKGFEYIGKAAKGGHSEAAMLLENLRRRQNTQIIKIDGTD
ncbi:MAG: sel1 repeat family protein [Candidatus Methanomethylophilus sp.]|nr:sel1 repeat family protein [Methanomethylophilus sp.]